MQSARHPALLVLLAQFLAACDSDALTKLGNDSVIDSAVPQRQPLRILDPTDTWAGKSLDEWAIEYVRWYYRATDCEQLPTTDVDGSRCDRYQDDDSQMFFFDRMPYGEVDAARVRRTLCEVPADRAIMVPMAAFVIDNAGEGVPAPFEILEGVATGVKTSMRELRLVADGNAASELSAFGVGPLSFDYHVPPVPNRYTCEGYENRVSDVFVDRSLLAGYFAIVAPPEPGAHELEYGSKYTYVGHDLSFEVNTRFVVRASTD